MTWTAGIIVFSSMQTARLIFVLELKGKFMYTLTCPLAKPVPLGIPPPYGQGLYAFAPSRTMLVFLLDHGLLAERECSFMVEDTSIVVDCIGTLLVMQEVQYCAHTTRQNFIANGPIPSSSSKNNYRTGDTSQKYSRAAVATIFLTGISCLVVGSRIAAWDWPSATTTALLCGHTTALLP